MNLSAAPPPPTLGDLYDMSTILIAAVDSPASFKARADYVCDGTADNTDWATAVARLKTEGGGKIGVGPGTFQFAAPVDLFGNNDVNFERNLSITGMGPANTTVVLAANQAAAFRISQSAQVQLCDLGVEISGSSHGVSSYYSGNTASGYRSFWNSEFRNLEFKGPWDGTHTGWAMHLGSFFRSRFANIEVGGVGGGFRIFSENANFNPGDSTFDRCFVDLSGNNKTAYSVESTTVNGFMNQMEFRMCEAIASGTGCTGIYLGGTGPVVSTKWFGINLEEFDTCFWVNNGEGNNIDGNYWNMRGAAAANTTQLIRFDTNARNNWVRNVSYWYAANATRLILSTATNTVMPNLVERVKIYADTGATLTNSISTAGAVLRKWTVAEGAGTATGVTVTPA
jgi:hypothetical protein